MQRYFNTTEDTSWHLMSLMSQVCVTCKNKCRQMNEGNLQTQRNIKNKKQILKLVTFLTDVKFPQQCKNHRNLTEYITMNFKAATFFFRHC